MPDPRPDLMALIAEAARRFNPGTPGVDFQSLLHRLVMAESGGDPNSISRTGAIGYTQLMPGTAREMGVNPYNPQENVMGGARYLAQGLKQYGNVNDALSRYNSGLPYARGSRIPGVSDYVSRVSTGKGLGTLPQQSSIKRKKNVVNTRRPAPAAPAAPTAGADPYGPTMQAILARLKNPGPPPTNPLTTPSPELGTALNLDPSQSPLALLGALSTQAAGAPNEYDKLRAQTEANQAQSQGTLDYYGQHPYPQATPSHFQYPAPPVRGELPLPNRQAPGGTLMETILGALGGLIAPQGAGYFAAAPLQAASDYADQQYRDNLTRYQLGTEQAANRYGDQRFGYEQSVDEQIRNAQAQQLAEQINQGRQITRTDQLAEPTAQLAGQRSLAGALPTLSGRQQSADLAGQQLGVVGEYLKGTERFDQRQQNAENQLLARLQGITSASSADTYRQGMLGLGQQRVDIQAQSAEERARHNKAIEGLRAKADLKSAADPVMNQYRIYRNELMKRHIDEAVLSPTQKNDLIASRIDVQSSYGLFKQAMQRRNLIETAIAEGRISDVTDLDPAHARQEAFDRAEEARQVYDTSLKRYQSVINALPQPAGVKPPAPAAPQAPPNVLGSVFEVLRGLTGGPSTPPPPPTPAKTGQANLPATPKAGKKTPPKPAPSGERLRYDPKTKQFH